MSKKKKSTPPAPPTPIDPATPIQPEETPRVQVARTKTTFSQPDRKRGFLATQAATVRKLLLGE